MRALALFSHLSNMLQAFRLANCGNVAMTFGLAFVPAVGLTGAAIDYSRTNSVKAGMQTALDATALMLAKEAPTAGQAKVAADAPKYFAANFNRSDVVNATADATYNPGSTSTLVVNGSATVPTAFMRIFGYNEINVTASATAKCGSPRLRVARALDNTGSMASDGKMTALKTATNSLITQLQSLATNAGDVYVSIVPFSKDVNINSSNRTADWIDWTSWDAANGTCSNTRYHSKSNCLSHSAVWTPADHSTWNGCVVDRGNNSGPASGAYHTHVLAPVAGDTAKMFAAEQYSSCTQASMQLNDSWTAMTTLVNGMSPAGNTNQGIGLALGWMS